MNRAAGERGRAGRKSRQISRLDWRDILVRVKDDVSQHNLTLIAAGVAFYALLSVFPALTALVSLYGLFVSPQAVVHHLGVFKQVLPPGAWDLIREQLQSIASQQGDRLTAGFAVGVLVALYSARKGMSSLMKATNIAYQEREKRGFFKKLVLSMLFTLVAIAGFVALVVLGLAAPLVLRIFHVDVVVQAGAEVLRWLLLWASAVLALAAVYRFAPARDKVRWRWVTWGSAIAATLWLVGSALFALYVTHLSDYQKTYGTLGTVIILLMWFYLSSFVVVLGAEINAQIERQTAHDANAGRELPMGQRGTVAGDTPGPTTQAAPRAGPQRRRASAHQRS